MTFKQATCASWKVNRGLRKGLGRGEAFARWPEWVPRLYGTAFNTIAA